jgi:hypothetical protein
MVDGVRGWGKESDRMVWSMHGRAGIRLRLCAGMGQGKRRGSGGVVACRLG